MYQPLPIGLYTFTNLIQISKDAILVLTSLEVSKVWPDRTFSEIHRNIGLGASKQIALGTKLIISVQMDCAGIAKTCLRQWVVFVITVLVKRHDLL